MEHFVTLFDSLFLPQGLALHASMQRHLKMYTLWILSVDDDSFNTLLKLDLPNVRLLQLSRFETDDLHRAKAGRSRGEYCWTLTPFAPRFVFEEDKSVSRVTYIDADLWFIKDPIKIFEEFESSKKSVLITEHAYAPEYDQSQTSGQFCVQFMVFERNSSEPVRRWWEEKCIEWCYARFEDGKFGDQKYLDRWPEIFEDKVHVLQKQEWALAPWNGTRFPWGGAIFFHFHGLRITSKSTVNLGPYHLPLPLRKYVYKPYLKDLRRAVEILESSHISIHPQQGRTNLFLNSVKRIRQLKIKLTLQLYNPEQNF